MIFFITSSIPGMDLRNSPQPQPFMTGKQNYNNQNLSRISRIREGYAAISGKPTGKQVAPRPPTARPQGCAAVGRLRVPSC